MLIPDQPLPQAIVVISCSMLVLSPRDNADRMLPKLDTLLHQCLGSLCFHNVRISTWINRILLNIGSNDSSHIGPFLFFYIVAIFSSSSLLVLVFLLLLVVFVLISEPPFLCRMPWSKVESVGVFFWDHCYCTSFKSSLAAFVR